jgi:F0F1-type ATP synthase membrane subunit b/b'
MIETNLLYIFALIIVSLTLLCISVLVLYFRLIGKYEELRHGKEKQDVDPQTLIEQARTRSRQILEEAHAKSVQIISRSEAYLAREESVLGKELEKAQASYQKSFDSAISASQSKAEQMIQNIPQDIKMTLISVIDNFRVSLAREVQKTQDDANKTIREAYQTAAEEVSKYKEERMRQVDESILSVVKDVTEKVIGKSVSAEEHEKLVLKSLEEAKRQKIF